MLKCKDSHPISIFLPSQTQNQGRLRGCLYQPCHQRLREYRFCVNIGRGVNIRSDKCFYIML